MNLPSYIAGEAVHSDQKLEVYYPWDNSLTGTVSKISRADLERAITTALEGQKNPLSRYDRHAILRKAAQLMAENREEMAKVICRETGLCMRETRYETGRTSDVLEFAAAAALEDDGQVFSCDISPQGKNRKIVTFRQPLQLVSAITPFNHPLNQVAHKVAPAIAAGAPMILKPSEKTPLTAIRFAEIMYEAGLPGWMLSVFVGDLDEIVQPMITDDRVELVSFTGSVQIGKLIASQAGYKKTCLELGGNSPLIILNDADLDKAVTLAAEGSFRNSGQRCTAVKRILVQEGIVEEFTKRFVEKAKEYVSGDPEDSETRVGTVIDENAAIVLEERVKQAEKDGAKVLLGGGRRGALMEPTVIANVPRDTPMVAEESFGPLAPIITIKDLDDAIEYYNSGNFGLSSGIVTNDLQAALKAAKHLRTGTTNINEVPGYRIEKSPFGGIKDSGLGIKEGVNEAMKFMTTTKTFSFPWE
ncbi:aldehyde dehydrogenase (NAD+) [Rubritalea squalenifaciens DSM 18772]|uniref:Aldehyde dehydrogenase (NAD+) n=1 Tax=Rubritalea squalenifaciens DSM 18772 TaxID=1123071 RepID=A0A1M6PXE0_9BACT|nr:phosphonoacetaldehyde dehydrogenase [Rubritalea squalenifaciens]SHK12588.1 aldehyde dehydrogenase (NAD+) [Rubritalea squalenifaciens DSM 18772]